MALKRKLKNLIRGISPNAVDQMQRVLGKKDKTYAGEFQALRSILDLFGNPKEFGFVDIGAGDGFNMSIAWPLAKQFHAYGLLVEPNVSQLNKARLLYQKNRNFEFSTEIITPTNVHDTILKHGFGNSLYMKIDIDSYDLEIFRAAVSQGFQPRIISIEINELFPPPVRYEMRYSDELVPIEAPFYGCSLQSAFDFATSNGYLLHTLAFNNAFFVLEDSLERHQVFRPLSPKDAYCEGFLNRRWSKLFPWDVEYEEWLSKSPKELVQIVRSHPNFNHELLLISEG